jgi:hypothetical protein
LPFESQHRRLLSGIAIAQMKDILYRSPQDLRYSHSQMERRVISVILNCDNSLAGNPAFSSKILLAQAARLTEGFHVIIHKVTR